MSLTPHHPSDSGSDQRPLKDGALHGRIITGSVLPSGYALPHEHLGTAGERPPHGLPSHFEIENKLRLTPNELVDLLAEFLLAAAGRKRSIQEFVASSGRMKQVACIYANEIEPRCPGMLQRRIKAQGLTSSVPLVGLRTLPASVHDGLAWGARSRFDRAFMRTCPNALGRSDEDLRKLEERAAQVDWRRVGELLEPAIRARLGLERSVGLSVCVFGSFLWKATPGDIDMIVVVEDPNCRRVTVGRPSLHAAGLREFMPEECRPKTDMVELCVVGIGALEEGQHLSEVTDLLVAPTTGGLWVKGLPLLQDMADLTVAQKWLSCLGNGVQESAMDPGYSRKAATLIPFARRLLLHTMKKYDLPEVSVLESQLLDEGNPQSPADLVEAYLSLREPSIKLIEAITQRCADEVGQLLPRWQIH